MSAGLPIPSPLAVCDQGHAFIVPNMLGGALGGRVTFVDLKIGPCPVCGRSGTIASGTYEFDESPLMDPVADHVRRPSPADQSVLRSILQNVGDESRVDS